MAITKSRLALIGVGYVLAAVLSYFVALWVEGFALQRVWHTPGYIVFLYILPLMGRGVEPPLWLFWVPILIDGLLLFGVICAPAFIISTVYRFYNS
jgi:hypothetical protein